MKEILVLSRLRLKIEEERNKAQVKHEKTRKSKFCSSLSKRIIIESVEDVKK